MGATLSATQFGGLQSPAGQLNMQGGMTHPEPALFAPRSHGLLTGQSRPQWQQDYEAPLPAASWSNGAYKQQIAWRKPNHVLPYSVNSMSSVFLPGGGATE